MDRKLVSWRLEKLEKEQQVAINAWLNAQQNIQLSLTNVVQHMIDRFGVTDIMNYDVQKALYTNPDATVIERPVKNEIKEKNVEDNLIASSPEQSNKQSIASKDKEDDLYGDLAGDL